MYRIALINMPCASVHLPSLALTQLKSVLDAELAGRAEVEIFYVNLDFAHFLGTHAYDLLSGSMDSDATGLGDWFFRQAAFPELPDNSDSYLLRHFSKSPELLESLRSTVLVKRPALGAWLDELIDRYGLDRYPMVGFTSMFSQNVAALAMARKLKQRDRHLVTLVGGPNCESPMGQVIAKNSRFIDYVFSGPALKTLPRLVRHLMDGEKDRCDTIHGVFSRLKLALQPPGAPGEIGEELDIDEDVPLDYENFFAAYEEKKLPDAKPPKILFETSRGCWWGERAHCTFCGLNGVTMGYRAMRPDKALRQLENLFERYGSRVSSFNAVDNILPKEYFTEVLPHLQPPPGATIFYEIKANVKENDVRLLASSGIRMVQPGIEALDTATLKLMRKGTTSFQNIKLLKYCLIYDVEPAWNMLIGFPGEGEEVYEKYYADMPKLVHLPPPDGVNPVRFDRFSPYYMQSKDYGLELKPFDFYGMIYPFDDRDLRDLAYYFTDDNHRAPYAIHAAKWLNKLRQRFDEWSRLWTDREREHKPELTFIEREGKRRVYDSRSGVASEHRISDRGLRVLESLEIQTKLSQLAKKLRNVPEPELEREVESLCDLGLIFRDEDVYMSLVVDHSARDSDVSVYQRIAERKSSPHFQPLRSTVGRSEDDARQ